MPTKFIMGSNSTILNLKKNLWNVKEAYNFKFIDVLYKTPKLLAAIKRIFQK
jgi:hypothetical protein